MFNLLARFKEFLKYLAYIRIIVGWASESNSFLTKLKVDLIFLKILKILTMLCLTLLLFNFNNTIISNTLHSLQIHHNKTFLLKK